jgi:hypothetical protein
MLHVSFYLSICGYKLSGRCNFVKFKPQHLSVKVLQNSGNCLRKQRQLPEKIVKVPQNGRSFVLYALAAMPRLFPFKEGTVKKIVVYCCRCGM